MSKKKNVTAWMLEGDGDPVDRVTARSKRPLLSIDRRVTPRSDLHAEQLLEPQSSNEQAWHRPESVPHDKSGGDGGCQKKRSLALMCQKPAWM
jgi:hypothetical protein